MEVGKESLNSTVLNVTFVSIVPECEYTGADKT